MGEILGRFHPLVVHLPVGMLILAFVMEIASRQRRWQYLKKSIPFVLQITIGSAVLAWFTGWIMPKEGAFDEQLVNYHFWSSLAMTITVILVYLTNSAKSIFHNFYFPLFLLSMILLGVAGHFGGGLTHGIDHLTSPISEEKIKTVNVDELLIYHDIIQPIFKKKCNSCHNDAKKKGALVLSTISGIRKGGESGQLFISGNPENSLLISQLHLPIEHKKHMPPNGRVQLTEDEIKLLNWWVAEGGAFEHTVADVDIPLPVRAIIEKNFVREELNKSINLKKISESEIDNLAQHGIFAYPLDAKSPMLIVNMSRSESISKVDFRKLVSFAKNVVELDASFSNFDDNMMSYLPRFKNLQKLKLQKTSVTERGLSHLEKLDKLSFLNLYGTQVNNKGFESISKIKNLSELFLWSTKVTNDQVDKFKKEHPNVDVDFEIDNTIFGDAQLKPPVISADQVLFNDTLRIHLSRNIINASVYYTLDGTVPDTNSIKYDTSFLITNTCTIKSISVKEAWITSEYSNKTFVKVKHKIADLNLEQPPSPKYKAKGVKSLYDLKKGSVRFSEGDWLGFEGQDMNGKIDLGEVKSVESVAVSCLEDTDSYIFFPKRLEIATSIDGNIFTEIEEIEIPIAKEPKSATTRSFLLQFEQREARYIQLKVKGIINNPDWHIAPGAKSWLFIDEILVN